MGMPVVLDAYIRSNVPPYRVRRPLPSALGACIVVDNFLSGAECRAYIAQAESIGFRSASPDYPPSYRNNDRLVLDDAALAGKLFDRLQSIAPGPDSFPVDGHAQNWRLDSVNARLRFCRYTQGQRFNIHQDGVHHRSPDLRSMLTFMIYLNDGSDFSGGDTLFFASGPLTRPDANPVVARVRPKMGSLILFDHGIWHAGETVTAGTKYIMRSDVLFRRVTSASRAPSDVTTPTHRGYVWSLAGLDHKHFASAGRDCRIRLWDRVGTCTGELAGHTQSVLGLACIDDEHLASVSRDRTLRIWNLKSRQCISAVRAHDAAVLTVAALGAGRIATGAADHKIKLWNVSGKELAAIEAHTDWVWKVVRVTDSLIASASEDGSVKVWSTETLEMVARLEGTHELRTVAAAPNGNRLATGDVTGRLRVWTNVLERPRIEAEFLAHEAAIRCVHFIDSGTIATGGEDCRLKIWGDWPLRVRYQAQHSNFVTDFDAFDQRHGVSCSYDGKISPHEWGEPT
jgi:WD40 repeat protein/predicted 2-oxoglutarate/Fe(II)-dependent dioxygenase YbiX